MRDEKIVFGIFCSNALNEKSIMRYFGGHSTNDNGTIDGLKVAEVGVAGQLELSQELVSALDLSH